MFAWLPFLAADLGCMFGGRSALTLQKRGVGLINARRCAFTLGALMMTGVAFVGLSTARTWPSRCSASPASRTRLFRSP